MSSFLFSTLCINLSLQCLAISIANFKLLNNKILQFNWTCITQGTDNYASSLSNNIFIEFCKLCIPRNTILVREGDDLVLI